jgi:hypothetical protein
MLRKATGGAHGALGDRGSQPAQAQAGEVLQSIAAMPAGLAQALGTDAPTDAADAQTRERQARLERHRNFLDANGGIGHLDFVGVPS